jgi:hypothetical protein
VIRLGDGEGEGQEAVPCESSLFHTITSPSARYYHTMHRTQALPQASNSSASDGLNGHLRSLFKFRFMLGLVSTGEGTLPSLKKTRTIDGELERNLWASPQR